MVSVAEVILAQLAHRWVGCHIMVMNMDRRIMLLALMLLMLPVVYSSGGGVTEIVRGEEIRVELNHDDGEVITGPEPIVTYTQTEGVKVDEEQKKKVDTKIDAMKMKRAGKTVQLDVVPSQDKNLNFQNTYDEMRKIADIHTLIPDELFMLGAQMQQLATNTGINMRMQRFQQGLQDQLNSMFAPKDKTHEEKVEEKLEKEKAEGKVRVRPGGGSDGQTGNVETKDSSGK